MFLNCHKAMGEVLSGRDRTGYNASATGPREGHVMSRWKSSTSSVIGDNGRSEILRPGNSATYWRCRYGAGINTRLIVDQIGGHGYGSIYREPPARLFSIAWWDVKTLRI